MVSYIELHFQTFTLNNLHWSRSSVRSQRPSPSCHKVYSQPCYRKSFLPYFPSSPSFFIYYHLSLSLSSLPHLHYPPPSSPGFSLICIFCSLPTFPSWWWSHDPKPSGRGVPDGLTGRRFRTDPCAADPVLPQSPGGLGGNTYLKHDERQRTGLRRGGGRGWGGIA